MHRFGCCSLILMSLNGVPLTEAGQATPLQLGAGQVDTRKPEAAVNVLDRFESRTFQGASGKLLYRLLSPPAPASPEATSDAKSSPPRRYPLVVFFHGAGERGDDNQKQLVHGMSDFASDKIRQRFPCFVVAPQCPDGQMWVDTPWTELQHKMPERPTDSMALTLQLVEQLMKTLPIDRERVYVTGLSMGGFGAWDAAQRRPELFAAAAPVCGGGDETLAKPLSRVAVWAFHGADDPVVKPARSRNMIAALRAAGAEPKYTEYPQTGHNSWAATYRNEQLYEWLFSQRLSKNRAPDS